jgi:hypothetical protein
MRAGAQAELDPRVSGDCSSSASMLIATDPILFSLGPTAPGVNFLGPDYVQLSCPKPTHH